MLERKSIKKFFFVSDAELRGGKKIAGGSKETFLQPTVHLCLANNSRTLKRPLREAVMLFFLFDIEVINGFLSPTSPVALLCFLLSQETTKKKQQPQTPHWTEVGGGKKTPRRTKMDIERKKREPA